MTTDPRTEIHKRIVRRLNTDAWMERHFGISAHAGDVADAVLELFQEIDVEPLTVSAGVIWPTGSEPTTHSRLVLKTAPEVAP